MDHALDIKATSEGRPATSPGKAAANNIGRQTGRHSKLSRMDAAENCSGGELWNSPNSLNYDDL
ncbi:hypothetical protein [Rhizobium sp. C4]|uniref:hypothetical protein n=1 Tax=Rhizobium sp. C4 TaxID=1349800 RepID=UPI001E4D3B31|nr:hypothetical protein [Rhizobium sp. C4]MCD2172771.1 hypothetical protein [Rhizobium sp. C4]